MNENLYAELRNRFPDDRSRTFLEWHDGTLYSYADLEAISGRYQRLLQELGVCPGQRVAVQVEKSPQALFLYLACLRAGAVYLPLNTAYTLNELDYFVGDARPRLVVCAPEKEAGIADLAARHCGPTPVLTLGPEGEGSLEEHSRALIPRDECAAARAEDIAAILYTSGTTGRSKGAMMSHGNLASNAETLRRFWGFTETDVLLHALPIFHTHGLFVATNVLLLAAGSMVFLPKFDADTVIARLPGCTAMMGVPTYYTRLLAHPALNAELVGHMRVFISGSAPLPPETFEAFANRTGHRILERYGMTETNMLTSNPLDGERVPGTVGRPLPGVELRIADETGRALPAGEIGVVEVRGPNVFKGYWGLPERTASDFREDGFFITGDLGFIDARGYLNLVGRSKDLIISGGFNVYPKEIELCIDAMEGVAESAVIGVPHPDFGEAAVAVVVRDDSRPPVSAAQIIAQARAQLANYKVPKQVYFVEELPRNAMAKVQKNVLRDRFKASFAAAAQDAT